MQRWSGMHNKIPHKNPFPVLNEPAEFSDVVVSTGTYHRLGGVNIPPLYDDDVGQFFGDGVPGAATGWDEVDPAANSTLADVVGLWRVMGTTADPTFKYRRALGVTFDIDQNYGIYFGPVLVNSALWSQDITYRFGIVGDTAGTPNEAEYIRAELQWHGASKAWRTRGAVADGIAVDAGQWFSMPSYPMPQPLWFRLSYSGLLTETRVYVGTHKMPQSHNMIQGPSTLVGGPWSGVVWSGVYLQFELSRGVGVGDDNFVYVGSVDFDNNL